MGDHGESCFGELVVDGVVDGTQIYVVVQQLAAHGQQQGDGVGLVLHRGQVKCCVLEQHIEPSSKLKVRVYFYC